MSDLSDIVKSFRTLENLLDSLSNAGLVKMRVVERPYRTTYIHLTDLGHIVAAKLQEIDEILNSEM